MKDPEDEAFEELSLKQGQWEHASGWRKKQILETSMTQDEIFNMAVKCYLISTGNREGFYGDALIQFAKMVAEKEREAFKQIIRETPFSNWFQGDLIEAIDKRGQALAQPEQDGDCKKCKDGCPACDARRLPNDLL